MFLKVSAYYLHVFIEWGFSHIFEGSPGVADH